MDMQTQDAEGLTLPKIDVDQKQLAELDEQARLVMEKARDVADSIVDDRTLVLAQKWCSQHMTFAKNLEETSWLAGIKNTWHKQHESVCAIIKKYASPHRIAVRTIVDPKILAYLNQKEIERAAAQKKLDEETKKRDEEARIARAIELEKQGKPAQAEQVLNKPGGFVAPKIEPLKTPGMSARKKWRVKPLIDEDNIIALIKGVAGGAVPYQAIEINYSWLNKQAQLMDGNLKYPGIECEEIQSLSHGRAA